MISIARYALVPLIALSFFAGAASAQRNYPTRAIRLVVPFAAGAGSNDIMARLIAQKLTDSLGQQIVVDNRPGASGIIGTDIAAKAQPDGYTVLMMSLTFTVNPSLYKKLPYNTEKDLVPVTLVASAPLMLVVHPSLPVKSVRELTAYAKARPGQLNFGSGGPGTTPHLAGEMFKSMAGVQITHVPYKGGAPALADLVSGQIQIMLENIPGTQPFVKAGKLRALAVTDKKRSALLPALPTLDESGLKGYELVGWNGLFVPAGTPRPVVTRLHAETAKALKLSDVKDRLATMGAEGVGNTPTQFAAFIKAEIVKWAKVVKQAGIRLE
ncbi:MAG: tripartite tricarboxylate transporter substrate binding protein [Betaproteobacteria bacterium]|nr:tripartite tricarboxylate transporter substrate binding protein [Betaproteobacteria bacterium]MBI3935678.1 tripartite tricarboxylate transporter substrate binding protein [Betaproteobacteria bacterium]